MDRRPTLVIDRPEGKAAGMGLGFNGGEMIALAIGGCFCNDLRYSAEAMGLDILTLSVDVTVDLQGEPLVVVGAQMDVKVEASDPARVPDLLRRTEAVSTVSNSVKAGFPVAVRSG